MSIISKGMHVEQFIVVYSISGPDAFTRYSSAIKVTIDDDALPSKNHNNVLSAIVNLHNSNELMVEATGKIGAYSIVLNCVTRLTK